MGAARTAGVYAVLCGMHCGPHTSKPTGRGVVAPHGITPACCGQLMSPCLCKLNAASWCQPCTPAITTPHPGDQRVRVSTGAHPRLQRVANYISCMLDLAGYTLLRITCCAIGGRRARGGRRAGCGGWPCGPAGPEAAPGRASPRAPPGTRHSASPAGGRWCGLW